MPAEADAEQALDPAAYIDRVMKKSSAGSGASTADTTSLQAELDKWAGFLLKEPNDKYLVGKRDAASAALAAAKDAVPTPERSVTSLQARLFNFRDAHSKREDDIAKKTTTSAGRTQDRAVKLLALRAQLNKAIAETQALCESHAAAHAARKEKRVAAYEAAVVALDLDVKAAQRAAADANIVSAGKIAASPSGVRIGSWCDATIEEFHDAADADHDLAKVGSRLSDEERIAAKAAAASEAKLELLRKEQWEQFRTVQDFASFDTLLPKLATVKYDVAMKPAFSALYQMLVLWQISSPNLLFTLGGMQAAMPLGVTISDVLNCILGDAAGLFFNLNAENRLGLVVSQQCIGAILMQLNETKWELASDEAKALGKKAWESIKRRRTEQGSAAVAAADEF